MNTPDSDITALGIAVGQRWRTRDGSVATVAHHIPQQPLGATVVYEWAVLVDNGGPLELRGIVTRLGRWMDNQTDNRFDFVELIEDIPRAVEPGTPEFERACIEGDALAASAVFEHIVHDAEEMATHLRVIPEGVGDINSTAKGSGARYNGAKTPLELVPLYVLAASFEDAYGNNGDDPRQCAIAALYELAAYQARGEFTHLLRAMDILGLFDGWVECAKVFDYGRRKYAEWNWAKGMAWSIPIACAARHLVAIIKGELLDPESELPHRGHVFCNLAMLATYAHTYPDGDDRADSGMLPLLYSKEQA